MRFRLAVLSLLATLAACSGGNLDGGTGGSAGDGAGGDGTGGATVSCPASGTAGFAALSTGAGGAGGDPLTGLGGAPGDTICPASIASGSGAGLLAGEDGMPLLTSMMTPVQIIAIDRFPNVPLTRITLVADTGAGAPHWIWSPSVRGLPDARFNVGDRFDLRVTGFGCGLDAPNLPCQAVELSRCGSLIAFTYQNYNRPAAPPSLAAWGIAVADGGVVCRFAGATTPATCQYQAHAARITMAQETLELLPGQSGSIGDLSFTLAGYGSPTCDGSGYLAMSGFRAP